MLRAGFLAVTLLLTTGASAQDEEPPPETSRGRAVAWGTFGGELGFLSGTALTAAAIVATMPDEGEPPSELGPAIGGLSLLGTIGLTVGGAALFANLARDGDWSLHQGWGATGIFPGIMEGIAVAGGFVNLAGDAASLEERLAAMLLGAAGGGAVGYVLFREMSEARGSASWETLAFWCGFLTFEAAAIIALSGNDMTVSDRNATMLLTTAIGGLIAPALVHILLR